MVASYAPHNMIIEIGRNNSVGLTSQWRVLFARCLGVQNNQ